MANKDLDKQHQQQPDEQGGGRKNNEEVGEPVQLNEDVQKGQQKDKPGLGQQQGKGQPQGGQHESGQHQGGGHPGQSNR